MKSQAARVVVMRSVAARLVFAFRHWDQQSSLDSAQKAAPSICGLRSSKSIRTGPAGAVLRRLPGRTLRSRRLANVHPQKFANNQRPMRRTNKALLLVTCPEGNDGPDRLRSDESENRMVGFLNRVRKAGRVRCISTNRTFSTCFGRRRSTADFSTSTNSLVISRDMTRQMTNARALNPPKKSAPSPIVTNNGSQIALSLSAAMNKSSAGLVHC